MQQILKRLELIKTAIALEDEEIIDLQVEKLSAVKVDDAVGEILHKISQSDYGNVIADIETYIARYSGVVTYEDREMQGLRLELKVLEERLQELSERKSEEISMIDDFNTHYHLYLGNIIQKILTLKEELLRATVRKKAESFEKLREAHESIKKEAAKLKQKASLLEKELEETDEFDDRYDELYEELCSVKEELDDKEEELERKRQETKEAKKKLEEDDTTREYEESRQDHEEFKKEYEEKINEERYELSDEEEEELKRLFRKAARLCHPDIVSDELKEKAQAMMQELNDSYTKKDLIRVREIFVSLENGEGFVLASDSITDIKILRTKITSIRTQIEAFTEEIEIIEQDETYLKIEEIDDWNAYFDRLQEELEEEYMNLQQRCEALKREKEEADTKAPTAQFDDPEAATMDDFWEREF